jgi:hypothetical protein|tara:strand:- start:46 stop:474 length:429 start_codon:yes stop_codon:yes gene_type:complete
MRSAYLEQNSGVTAGVKKKVENITVARTLTSDDSGKVFMLDSAGGAYSITLPTALEDGVYYKFVVSEETPTGAITIAAGSAIVSLVMKDAGGDASNSTVGTQVSNIVVGTSAQKGDYINVMAAGDEWVCECLSGINDAVTTS